MKGKKETKERKSRVWCEQRRTGSEREKREVVFVCSVDDVSRPDEVIFNQSARTHAFGKMDGCGR